MKKIKMNLKQIATVDDMTKIIEEVFGVKFDISGGWGYDIKSAVIVHSLEIPSDQFFHTFATIRANIEMNLTLEENERYGGINVHFIERKALEIENKMYDHITFEITAMKEKVYAAFIQEYKKNYGEKAFDLNSHFSRRKEATLTRVVEHWFLQEIENAK